MIKYRKFIPLLNRVLVKRINLIAKTQSGLILESKEKEASNIADVIAIGQGDFQNGVRIPMQSKIGDIVLLPNYGGTSVKLGDGQEYWVYKDDEILGALHEEIQ